MFYAILCDTETTKTGNGNILVKEQPLIVGFHESSF